MADINIGVKKQRIFFESVKSDGTVRIISGEADIITFTSFNTISVNLKNITRYDQRLHDKESFIKDCLDREV
jgi:hypothetical protein